MGKELWLVDMDGTAQDFSGHLEAVFQERFPGEHYLSEDDRRVYNLSAISDKSLSKKLLDIMNSRNFFRHIPWFPGATEAILEMKAMGKDVRICTSPWTSNIWCLAEKRDSVEANLGHGFVESLIFVSDKTLVVASKLIDDKPNIHGAMIPAWEQVVYDAPYNQESEHPELRGKRRLIGWKNWKAVLL